MSDENSFKYNFMGGHGQGHKGQVQPQFATTSSTSPGPSRGADFSDTFVCAHAKSMFPSMSIIEAAYWEAENFHNRGGNLKSIQLYLDKQLPFTYETLGMSYIPEKKTSHQVEAGDKDISSIIIDEIKEKDVHKRGGYDQGYLPGKFDPPHKALHTRREKRWIDVLEPNAIDRWLAAIGPELKCSSLTRIGTEKSYEDKYMCNYDRLSSSKTTTTINAKSKSHMQKNGDLNSCDLISIGSNDQWGFETVVTDETNCRTHTFDCTIGEPRKRPPRDSVLFYPHCISDSDKVMNERSYLSYSSIWKKTGMKGTPKLFKIDVEGFEYDVLTSMLRDAKELGEDMLPEQISIELHSATKMYDLPWLLRNRQSAEVALLTGMLYRVGGYLPVKVSWQEGCKQCLEVLYVRVFC
jgi:hypothetical protein